MHYRREIDGLRAIAVVPVILFHAGFEAFSGGYVGVDVFFVISGFLITTVLIEDIENNRFSIVRFYDRRARRILPALFFVILCCVPFAWMWMRPEQLKDFSQSVAAVGVFASNVLFWLESGYFVEAAEQKPLLHTWSLAVEEQYYVIFPIFLLFAWRFGREKVFWLIVGFAALSLGLSELGWRYFPSANFFLAPSRVWELFAGSIAAFIVLKRGIGNNDAIATVGLAGIIFSILFYDSTTPFPSLYTVIPVFGVVLLVIYGGEKTYVARLLSIKPLVGMGLISYSAYLWHQPLFAFARIRLLDAPSMGLMVVLIAVSVVLAIFSWRFIEQPFRGRTPLLPNQNGLFTVSIFGLCALVLFGVMGHLNKGYPERIPPKALRMANYVVDQNPYSERCSLDETKHLGAHPMKACSDFLEEGRADVLFIGDSHSSAVSYQAQLELKDLGIGSYAVAYGGCIGISGLYRVDSPPTHDCAKYNESMLNYARAAKNQTLVITSRFPMYHTGERFDNQEGGHEPGEPGFVNLEANKGLDEQYDSVKRRESVLEHFQSELNKLAEEFNVVLVYPIPEVGWDVPARLFKCALFGYEDCSTLTTSYAVYEERTQAIREIFDSLESERIFRVYPSDVLCNVAEEGRCEAVRDGDPLYFDNNHLANSSGAKVVMPLIVSAIQKSLQRQ